MNELILKGIKFANLNKNCTLDEYKEKVYEKNDYTLQNVLVKKTVFCSNDEYIRLSNSLMAGNELWEKIGGSTVLEESKVNFQLKFGRELDSLGYFEFYNNQDYLKWWQVNCFIEGVLVFNTDTQESFVVNTEGHEYARYVGIA